MWRKENCKAEAVPEKSNFTRRCSLLSRYLKEKGSFGNIDLGLLPKSESGNQNAMQKGESSEIKALELFQKVSKGEPSTSTGVKVKDDNLSESEAGSSQLTIFFGGKILVYNEFPSDKAKEIMEVAKQAMPVTNTNIQTQINVENNNNNNLILPDLNEPTNSAEINQQQQQQQNELVERIARRASLHRFFAKRKDRAVARAPYQVNQNAGHHQYPPKPETRTSQPLEPGQSSQRLQSPHDAVAHTVVHPKPEGDKHLSMEVEKEGQSSKDLELRL